MPLSSEAPPLMGLRLSLDCDNLRNPAQVLRSINLSSNLRNFQLPYGDYSREGSQSHLTFELNAEVLTKGFTVSSQMNIVDATGKSIEKPDFLLTCPGRSDEVFQFWARFEGAYMISGLNTNLVGRRQMGDTASHNFTRKSLSTYTVACLQLGNKVVSVSIVRL